jgi:hypothetical protein
MNSKIQIGLVTAILLLIGLLVDWKTNSSVENKAEDSQKVSASPTVAKKIAATSAVVTEDFASKSANPSHVSQLEDMTQTLFQFTRPEAHLRDLVDYLEQSHQEPLMVRNSNADTGEMVMVRTKSPLPGTRYFHAQYMTDENNQGFVQHMSFEYQPSPTAMKEAISAVQKAFPHLPEPNSRKDDFIRWNLDNDYIVWIKRMGPEDLKNDPFNAYTDDDIGTIRVAVELEIHEPGEHTN